MEKVHGIVYEFRDFSEKFWEVKSKKNFSKTYKNDEKIKRNQDFLILFGLIVHSNDIMSIIIHVYHYENKENSL